MPFHIDMNAIELLTTRSSNGKLSEPAPEDPALHVAFEAAARAPDHGTLRPWRVRVIRGSARERLGELMADTLRRSTPGASQDELTKLRQKALRAPVILVVGAHLEPNAKIPVVEQLLAAGAAAHAMLLAFHAQGYGAIWRTGASAYDDDVKRALGFRPQDAIAGFLYVGTPKQTPPAIPRPAIETFVSEWRGPEG